MRLVALAVLAGLALPAGVAAAAAPAPAITVTSSPRADLVTAGQAVVRVGLPRGTRVSRVRVHVGRRDVTRRFARRPNGRFEGLITLLRPGRNVLTVSLPNGRGARLTITDHPNGGPVFS